MAGQIPLRAVELLGNLSLQKKVRLKEGEQKMKTNTHGLKMSGLKKAAGDTKGIQRPGYCELFYDIKTGEIWTVYQNSIGMNTWTEYRDPAVLKVCDIIRQSTMQEIADWIYRALMA